MSFGRRRGWSDCIRGARARNLLSADDFAAVIGRPLNVALDISWSKTSAGDDHHGYLLRAFRKAAGRFLRERAAGGFTCTWARERPTHPVPRPNVHINCHIPMALYVKFVKNVHRFIPPGCLGLEPEAIYVQLIGFTAEDRRRRSEYLLKGAHGKARLKITRKRIPQGRIYGKRCGTSQDIGLASRLRWAENHDQVAKVARSKQPI